MEAKSLEQIAAARMRKEGFSLNEISKKLKVSKSSVSMWVRPIKLSKKAQASLAEKRYVAIKKSRETRISNTRRKLNDALEKAQNVVATIPRDSNHSKLYCALLYWCEGEKSKNDASLSFTNSDPALVRLFLATLRDGFNINESKFRVCIHLHAYHDTDEQLLFWSKITKIPLVQFIKPYHKRNSGRYAKNGYAGCASIRYYDVAVARELQAISRVILNT